MNDLTVHNKCEGADFSHPDALMTQGELDSDTQNKPVVGTWYPIETCPSDDRLFLVGVWLGERLYNEDYSKFVWAGKPKFAQTISHNENPQGPHNDRGWQHRNGPFEIKPTLWSPLPDEPELTDSFVETLNDTRAKEV